MATSFPEAALQIGDFYRALNRLDDAQREYEAGIIGDPKQKLVYDKRIVQVLIAQGRKDQALARVNAILKEHSDDYDARMMRASIDVDSGDPGKLSSGTTELQTLAHEKPG